MTKRYTSPTDVAKLFLQQNGRCAKCPRKITAHKVASGEAFEIDHIIALARGGTDTFDNKHLLCTVCHKQKTFGTKSTSYGSDIFEIAKEKRLIKGKPKSKSRWPKRSFGKKGNNAKA